nr:MAG: capsid protein [Chemarfal virus 81]
MLASYQPLPNFSVRDYLTGLPEQIMVKSQRPHVYLLPQKNEGGEMMLPYLNRQNYMAINDTDDFIDMGRIQFTTVTPLRSANGTVGTGVSIQVYAWATDVKLSAYTTSLALQSKEWFVQGDEYGNGAISRPASYVASIAGRLSSVPIIGRWATATQIGASAVSGIAKLFGFTNVPVLDDTKPYRPSTMPQLASTEIGYPVEKLTLDAKNELSVDPSIFGLPAEDELAMANLLTRDSYLTQFDWNTSNVVDDILFQCRVTPNAFYTPSNAIGAPVYFTPMAFFSKPFTYWRGDIIYRFDFMVSPFHKGRVKISFDPQGDTTNNLITQVNTSNVVITEIVDLAVHTSFEMRIPYQQAYPYLQIPDQNRVIDVPFSTTGSFSFQQGSDNGMFTVRVLNILTAPVATSPITVVVSARGADNLEYANPRRLDPSLTPFTVQSKETPVDPSVTSNLTGLVVPMDTKRALVNFGESVVSFRTLCRRNNFSHVIATNDRTITTDLAAIDYTFHKMPPFPGYDPAGIYSAAGQLTAGNFTFNYARMLPLQWASLCFVGYRGSIQWHFNPNMPNASINHFSVNRRPDLSGVSTFNISARPLGLTKSSASYAYYFYNPDTNGGVALTNTLVQTGLHIQLPNYSNFLFQSTDYRNATAPSNAYSRKDGAAYDTAVMTLLSTAPKLLSSATSQAAVEVFCGAGTDFSCIFFLSCPVLYKYDPNPTPN